MVFIPNAHVGYIALDEFERNQTILKCVFRPKESAIPGHRERLQAIDFIPRQTSSGLHDSS
jgi:hypothetical protein